MLDLARLRRIRVRPDPIWQRALNLVLLLDFHFPRPTEIVFEGEENLPRGGGAFIAMNHTDRYNYFPFLVELHRREYGFAAAWVKGKYYETAFVAHFMDAMNQIPLPSRGYVITTEFRRTLGRTPNEAEYRVLRDGVDGKVGSTGDLLARPGVSADVARFLSSPPEGMSGEHKDFLSGFEVLFDQMTKEVVDLTARALQSGLYVLVFPQGTRSVRLSQGHSGLVQVAQHLSAPIVPVGCNGSDRLYPGSIPFSRGGRVTYRIGAPLEVDGPDLAPHRVPPDVQPLTRLAGERYADRYEALTGVVMDRINSLLDPEYQLAGDAASDGVQGIDRFV